MGAERQKAVALISGGLDSMLAARLVIEQGVYVEGINFFTGFCVEGHTHAIRGKDRRRPKRNNALWVAEQLGIRLHFIDVVDEYKEVVLNPRHGYGRNLNPCLDCKSFMVGRAHQWMLANGFDFIVTGEVLNQRPMSQRRRCMPVVAADSGAGERLLRPLSARHLPPTMPEKKGWVDRERLQAFHGRSRKPQFALAASFGIEDYAQPAGGCCFLTDASYARKLQDLWQARCDRDYELDDIMLLKVGRHLRPRKHFKIIIGREEGENKFLEGYRDRYTHMRTLGYSGPLALVDGKADEADLVLAARLTARFSQGRRARSVCVQIGDPRDGARQLDVIPLSPQEVPREWYL